MGTAVSPGGANIESEGLLEGNIDRGGGLMTTSISGPFGEQKMMVM